MISELGIRKTNECDKDKVKVVGVGGGGCNAVSWMRKNTDLDVEYAVINTDPKDFGDSDVSETLLIGSAESSIRGTGGNCHLGERAAKENGAEIEELIKDTDLLFLIAGLGGGTGTGSTPVIAQIARELKIPTVAIVTLPFACEGPHRTQRALGGVEELKEKVDILMTIANNELNRVVSDDATFKDALNVVNNVTKHRVQEIGLLFQTERVLDSKAIWQIAAGNGCEEGRIVANVYPES